MVKKDVYHDILRSVSSAICSVNSCRRHIESGLTSFKTNTNVQLNIYIKHIKALAILYNHFKNTRTPYATFRF